MANKRPAPLTIGQRVEMFVDDFLIGAMHNASLKMNPPQKRETALKIDRPWEGLASGIYSCIFKADDKYRMYYRATFPNTLTDKSEGQACCYAESTDGIHWERPHIGLHEFEGSTDNNIVVVGSIAHNFSPFLDTNPNCPPDEKYKAVAGYAPEGLFAFKSPDGIHFTPYQEEPIIKKGAFDSHNLVFWDAEAQHYKCYSRYFASPAEPNIQAPEDSAIFMGVRAIQLSISEDFINWSSPQPNRYKHNVPLEHFYTNATIPCPGAEHIYMSFPMRFMPERQKVEGYFKVGVSDNVMMSSRDGELWDRTFMEAWMRPGLDRRNWTQRSLMPAWGILETEGDEFSMYINEHYQWDDSFVTRVTVPRFRFASVNAAYKGGVMTTKRIVAEGNRLILNYSTSAPGSIRVGLIDQDGWPIPHFSTEDCDVIYGDELEREVSWRGSSDLSPFRGKTIRLKFELKDADLYALQFAD